MSREAGWADATPLGNITTGLVLMTLWPVLFGLVDTTAMVAVMPWALAAIPFVVLTSVVAIRNGEILPAVANGILSGLTLCQNGIWGAVVVCYTAAGTPIPQMVAQAKGYVDGAAFLSAAFMLLWITVVFSRLKNWPMAAAMGVICLGFCCMGLSDLGLVNLRLPAAICVVAFAAWMVYSGCAMLVHRALGSKLLPY